MSDSKRQCSKCQFFQTAQLSGNGWCTHPKRQVASDIKILVREKELACRNSWGDDLWVDAAAGASGAEVVAPARRGLFHLNNRVDDEVTSVVDTSARHDSGKGSNPLDGNADDVVTLTSVRHDDAIAPGTAPSPATDDLNAPAIADQAERARLMARGSKDAVQKARERHTQRRKPLRATITPDEPESSSDRVLEAQDRGQYNRTRETDDRDDYRDTPPVPREEVAANGNALSPARGTDERFDTRARLKPEVDLTQLRGFLTRAGTSRHDADGGAAGSSNGESPYDLVLKRAQEIKAAGDVEREYHRSTLNGRHDPEPASDPDPAPLPIVERGPVPDLASPVTVPRTAVVWDVNGQQLSVAFERARAAIEQPIQVPPVRPNAVRGHDHAPAASREPISPEQAARVWTDQQANLELDDGPDPLDEFDDRAGEDRDPAGLSTHAATEPEGPYDDWDEDEPDSIPSPVESPRGSWWRSLNFGRKRRYRSQPMDDAADMYGNHGDDPEIDDEYVSMDDDAPFPGHGHDDDVDDRFTADVGNGVAPFPVFLGTDDIEPMFATSDESWMQDEWEFPEPQPVEWHESRARLLESSWEPVVPETRSIGAASTLTASGDQFVSFQSESRTAIASRPPDMRAYSFDEPSGMETLRAALFGEDRQPSGYDGDARDVAAPYVVTADRSHRQPSHTTEPQTRGRDRVVDRTAGQAAGEAGRFFTDRPDRISTFGHSRGAFASDFDIRDAIDDQDDEFEREFDVASRVPKACSTCRSFRPLDNGERGWCTNDWASTHRQMVNAGDLACRSSIGDWWLAADTSWIPPSDVIQPNTPRTDRLVTQSSSREVPATRRSQRVRTSKVS